MNLKKVVWLGNSKKVVSSFPANIKEDMGFEIYQLQQGKSPLKSRPMKSIAKGVFEIKEQDHQGWYRIIYTLEISDKIYILHGFKKQSGKTERRDLDLAKKRLKGIEDEKE